MSSLSQPQIRAVRAYVNDSREQMLTFLSDLVLAESPSTEPDSQEIPLALLRQALEELGFAVDIHEGEQCGGLLLAQPKSADSAESAATQLLLGHCDTVWPLGTLEQMPLLIEDNVVRGPGVFDMKAGLTAIIFALRAVQAADLDLPFVPVVLVTSDEEIGSHDSLPTIRREAQRARRALVLEPALGQSGMLKTARKGVGTFELMVHGRAAHAGLDPGRGISAVLALSYLIQDLDALNDAQKGVTVTVGQIEGGLRSNVIAPDARAVIDARALTADDARQVKSAIYGLRPPMRGIRLEVTGDFGRPPMERTLRNRALWRKAQDLGRSLGLHLEEGTAGGGSDGNYTSEHAATLDGLGAVGDGAHALHEHILIDKLLERTTLLALLLAEP